MSLGEPHVPVNLREVLGVRGYSRLIDGILVRNVNLWKDEGELTNAEVDHLAQVLSFRGLQALEVIAISTHPYARTPQLGGSCIEAKFHLTNRRISRAAGEGSREPEDFHPVWRLKIHPDKIIV